MASSLIDSMAGDFDPTAFTDSYREALKEVIDVKIGKKEMVAPPPAEEKVAPTIDLMAALRQSVERARTSRTAEQREPATVTPITKKATEKKAAKKTTEKRAAPKKAAGKAAEKKAAPKKAAPKKAAREQAKKTGKKAA